MIRVSVMYPYNADAKFDHDYYVNKHMPFVRELLEPLGLVRAEVDKGLAGGPGVPPVFEAIAHMVFESMGDFQAAFAKIGNKLNDDVPNYTDIVPKIQISEMV